MLGLLDCWQTARPIGLPERIGVWLRRGVRRALHLLSALPVTTRESKNKALQLVLECLLRGEVQPGGFQSDFALKRAARCQQGRKMALASVDLQPDDNHSRTRYRA